MSLSKLGAGRMKPDDTRRLIDLFIAEPVLWDPKKVRSTSANEERKQARQRIAEAMNMDGLTEQLVNDKIRGLRVQYAKELRIFCKSQFEGGESFEPKWHYFDVLDPYLRPITAEQVFGNYVQSMLYQKELAEKKVNPVGEDCVPIKLESGSENEEESEEEEKQSQPSETHLDDSDKNNLRQQWKVLVDHLNASIRPKQVHSNQNTGDPATEGSLPLSNTLKEMIRELHHNKAKAAPQNASQIGTRGMQEATNDDSQTNSHQNQRGSKETTGNENLPVPNLVLVPITTEDGSGLAWLEGQHTVTQANGLSTNYDYSNSETTVCEEGSQYHQANVVSTNPTEMPALSVISHQNNDHGAYLAGTSLTTYAQLEGINRYSALDENDDEAFGEYLAQMMRFVRSGRQKIELQIKLQELVAQYVD